MSSVKLGSSLVVVSAGESSSTGYLTAHSILQPAADVWVFVIPAAISHGPS